MQALDVKIEPEVKEALVSLGRTEDVCLCPDRRRLAIAGINGNVILLLELAIDRSASGVSVSLANPMQVTSPELSSPHGLDFLDLNTLIVANRTGSVTLLPLPESGSKLAAYQASSLTVEPSDWTSLLRTPGSVTVWKKPDESFSSEREIFICNNYANTVTRHQFSSTGQIVARSEVLL
ncbi:MAG: LpqB family beta-propeller domain-containing protein, partial [Vulcanimicrobiota bacterium]